MTNTTKFIVALVIATLALWGYVFLAVSRAEAAFPFPVVTICHKQEQPHVTLSVPTVAVLAHLAHGDTFGACSTVTPTPTPSNTPTPTPTQESEECEEEVSRLSFYEDNEEEDCEPEVTPTPSEVPHVQPQRGVPGEPGTFMCPDGNTVRLPVNFHLFRDGDIADLRWVPTEGNQVNIYWKNPKNNSWEHSARDLTNDGREVIGGLGKHDWTFGLQQKTNCGGGPIVNIVDGNVPMLFRWSYISL